MRVHWCFLLDIVMIDLLFVQELRVMLLVFVMILLVVAMLITININLR